MLLKSHSTKLIEFYIVGLKQKRREQSIVAAISKKYDKHPSVEPQKLTS